MSQARDQTRHVADPYRHGNETSISGKGAVITIMSTGPLSYLIHYFKQAGKGITINYVKLQTNSTCL